MRRSGREGVRRDTIGEGSDHLWSFRYWSTKRNHAPARSWARRDLTLPPSRRSFRRPDLDQIAEIDARPTPEQQGELGRSFDQRRPSRCLGGRGHAAEPRLTEGGAATCRPRTGAAARAAPARSRDDWVRRGGRRPPPEEGRPEQDLRPSGGPNHPALASGCRDRRPSHPGGQRAFATEGGEPINERLATRAISAGPSAAGNGPSLRGCTSSGQGLASTVSRDGPIQRSSSDQVLGHHTGEMERLQAPLLPHRPSRASHNSLSGPGDLAGSARPRSTGPLTRRRSIEAATGPRPRGCCWTSTRSTKIARRTYHQEMPAPSTASPAVAPTFEDSHPSNARY